MRTFVAFDLAIRVVENLVLLQEDLDDAVIGAGAKPRWIDAANIHLTMKFIGDADDALTYRIRDQLRKVAERHGLFEMSTLGTGCFPNARTPRIIWAGTGAGAEMVHRLQGDVESHLDEVGIARERRSFHPHVTIGRVKTPSRRVDLEPALLPFRDTDFGSSQIKDIVLFESKLHPSGAKYRVIERFPLGSA